MDRKIRFLQVAKHTDDEITAFLQSEAEKGWWLKKVRGNYFTFIKRPYEGKRICARTYFTSSAEIPTETQLRKELPKLRRNGWDMIAIGGPENIADTRRHAFLYEEKPDKNDPVALPGTDKDQDLLASKRGRKKAFSGLLLCFLYLVFWSFVVYSDWLKILFDDLYLFFSLLFTVLLSFSIVFSASAFVSTLKKDREKEIRTGRCYLIDRATNILSSTLLILCLFLACDYFYSNAGKSKEKLCLNDTVIEIFSDEVPVPLESLGIEVDHPYRSTRYTSRMSIFGSTLYAFDEAFGSKGEGVDYVSYTVLRTGCSALRAFASDRFKPEKASGRPEVADELSAQYLYTSYDGRQVLIGYNDAIISVKAGFVLSNEMLKTISHLVE